ncbi:MAG: hypothetical protein ACREO3_05825 [Arenimonas sp.]
MTYFNGEKNGGLVLVAIAIVGLAAAVTFWQPRWELRSFAVTLGILAVAELALGIGLYLRTDPQVANLLTQFGSNGAGIYSDEVARMVRVQRNFVVIQYVEVAIIIGGALVALLLKGRPWVAGIALGLLIHAAVLLAFDLVAERRGAVYLAAIKAGQQASPS